MNSRAPINFRTFLVVAVAMVAAIFCAYAYIHIRALGITLAVLLFCVLGACTAVFFVRYVGKKSRLGVAVTFALSTVLCISAFIGAAVYGDMRKDCAELGGYRNISGRVCAAYLRDGEYKINIENLSIDGNSAYGIMRVTFSSSDRNIAEFLDYGDNISFSAYVTAIPLSENGVINGSSCRTKIIYYATADEDIDVSFGAPTALEGFLHGWHELLVDNMGDRYGNIAFSMLTGDKYGLDSEISDIFSASGLGHIMAVSGLHIGFVIALLNLVLSRVDKRIRFPIISAFMIAYMVIADFSPSVVRAVIMATVSGLSLFVGGRRDLLSSLMCAFSLILTVKPMYLFDVGFLLSFGALFGIAMFADSVARFFKKHGAHHKVAGAIGSSVSVQAGIIPTQIYFFHSVQPLAVIVNMFLIPYISIAFIAVLCCSAIGAIPACGVVLKPCMYLLMPIDFIARGIAAVPYSSLTVYATAAVFLCYPAMFFASEFFMMKKGKLSVILYSLAVCIAFCAISAPRFGNVLVAVSYGSSAESLVCLDGKNYYVGYVDGLYATRQTMEKYRIDKLDGIYLLGAHAKTVDNIVALNDEMYIDAVYYCEFDEFGEELIDRGVNFALLRDESPALAPVFVDGKFRGYGCGDVFFATGGADDTAFDGYTVVRTETVTAPRDDVLYLCNYCSLSSDNIMTLDGVSYEYKLA